MSPAPTPDPRARLNRRAWLAGGVGLILVGRAYADRGNGAAPDVPLPPSDAVRLREEGAFTLRVDTAMTDVAAELRSLGPGDWTLWRLPAARDWDAVRRHYTTALGTAWRVERRPIQVEGAHMMAWSRGWLWWRRWIAVAVTDDTFDWPSGAFRVLGVIRPQT